MRWKKWLENWDMTSLKINVKFLEMEWKPNDEDKAAAWELYIELLTRITTQPLPPEDGVEKTALDSVYSLFPLIRDIIKRNGQQHTEHGMFSRHGVRDRKVIESKSERRSR